VVNIFRRADQLCPPASGVWYTHRGSRQYGIAEQTFYAWKKKYAHLDVSELRRLRQVEEENARLRRLVADLSLDKHMLSEALRKKV
jgi:putative transposase